LAKAPEEIFDFKNDRVHPMLLDVKEVPIFKVIDAFASGGYKE
jgi:hypothetical protein